jgi:hypothetical protein
MANQYRVQLYWPGRDDAPGELAGQIAAFLSALGSVHKDLAGWHFAGDGAGAPVPVDSPAACLAALERHRIAWTTGKVRRIAYGPRFFLEREVASPAAITVTCGIPRLDLGPIFTPNRLEMLVRADAGEARASRPVLEAALRAAVAAFRPDFGFAGTEGTPAPPLPVFSDGTPVVGWMTYLSAAYPPLPAALPKPAVVVPMLPHGALIVAHPELFQERDPAHREAIARVDEALRAAEVLVPAHTLGL